MDIRLNGVLMHAAEHGTGRPLVALHGAGVDHRDVESAIEAVVPSVGYRRIYPDLPGMGRSTAEGLAGNSDVVDLLIGLLEGLGQGPVLLLGHSYGAYLARAVAARRPDLVAGLALVCPFGDDARGVPEHRAVLQDDTAYAELAPEHRAGFDEYFVVRTPATARRYRDSVAPGVDLVDETALGRIFDDWAVDVGGDLAAPTTIVAGRRDSVVGFADSLALLERYPNATATVVEHAGHALMHERPELFAALLREWLARSEATGASLR